MNKEKPIFDEKSAENKSPPRYRTHLSFMSRS